MSTETRDLMIDIETLASSHDAVMIQLAAVFFDRHTGKLDKEFCMSISAKSCLGLGFVESEETLKWWSEQNQEVFEAITTEAKHVAEVMQKFKAFLGEPYSINIWSHATFDFPIVQNYLMKLTNKRFNFRNAKDIRTLVDLSGINLDDYDWEQKTHNALDDCKFQIQYCVDAFNKLGASNT